jgi:hypothetical protein
MHPDLPRKKAAMRSRRIMIAGLAAALAVTAVPVGQAVSRDRDGDRMPDRWERTRGLSTRTDDSARDPDRDHLTNSREYRLGTHPRERDTGHDGIRDGNEDADHDGVRNRDDRDGAHNRGDDHGGRHDSRDDSAHEDA